MISTDRGWWTNAVVYQIYPRSFADGNADGTGDIAGIINALGYLSDLGVDALWISPWYPSPMADGGYDVADYCDIDSRFGTIAQAEQLIGEAHQRGLRVLIDLVPNHCSNQHRLFQQALAAGPGSPERSLFHFLDGRGPDGAQAPNNWGSLFGGPAWERVQGAEGPEQWYLHMFAPEQPDWNWANPVVADFFDEVIRFWLDREVDGLRIDVADGLVKQEGYPDAPIDPSTGLGFATFLPEHPWWNRPELEGIQRRWRSLADDYAHQGMGERIFVCEANVRPLPELMRYLEPGRMQSTFNFDLVWCEWKPASLRAMIQRNLSAHADAGSSTTWVLGNHDVPRVATRYGKLETGRPFTTEGADAAWQHRFADYFFSQPTQVEVGQRRARAAALLELALPGSAYIYQGEELGLPEVEDLPDEVLDDPAFFRSKGRSRGRDGCRVPLPWSDTEPPYGFGSSANTWLPQPSDWAKLSVQAQDRDPASTLNLYREALRLRWRIGAEGAAELCWHEDFGNEVLYFTIGSFGVLVNFSQQPVVLPPQAMVLLASSPLENNMVPGDTAVWMTLAD